MALKQHLNERIRFDQQVDNSRNYVLPFVSKTQRLTDGKHILEIGCGEGGVLVPFIEAGCNCVGVDLNPARIDLANNFLKEEVSAGKVEFLHQNVYDEAFLSRFKNHFDLIILKDAIEHIPEQEKFIPYLKNFLRKGGQIYFGFPPWWMPFGGHQQVCRNKFASVLPWYHLLPKPLYKGVLKLFGEHDLVIEELLEIKDTQITIERFESIVRQSGLKILNSRHFLVNPIYKYKFGLQPRKQSPFISGIPYLRNVLTTCVYYTVG